jgi:hypothetical protein
MLKTTKASLSFPKPFKILKNQTPRKISRTRNLSKIKPKTHPKHKNKCSLNKKHEKVHSE